MVSRKSAPPSRAQWEMVMILPKTDVLTCILMVAATLLVGLAKCQGCTSRFP